MKKNICLLSFVFYLSSFVCLSAQNGEMRIASFNVRNDNSGDAAAGNGWANRIVVIKNMILFHDWDIIGTQECKNNQVIGLRDSLARFGYNVIGRGRGKKPTDDEFSAIFYKSSRFELLANGDFWLSETPNTPSKGWDAAINRICTWGKLKEIATGFVFFAFNLHYDHIGVTARLQSSHLVLQKIAEIAANQPVVLTGDFNVPQTSESYAVLENSDLLADSYTLAPIKLATNGTFNNFNPANFTSERIDHIFVTQHFAPLRYGVLTDNYWTNASGQSQHPDNFPAEVTVQQATPRLPSDHYPVVVVVKY